MLRFSTSLTALTLASALAAQGIPEGPDAGNANGTAAGATAAAVGTQCYGSFDMNGTDNDFWSFTVQAGDRVVVWTTERGGFTYLPTVSDNPALELIAPDGVTVLASNDDSNGILHAQIAYSFTTAGTYYINAIAMNGDTGDYALDFLGGQINTNLCNGTFATAAPEVEPNDDCASATTSNCCDQHVNTLQTAGDTDYYQLVLPTDSVVTWETHASTAVTGAACPDTKVWLYDSTCTQINSDDDGGAGLYSKLTQTLTAGTYYLEVSDWQRSGTGDYSLTIDCSVVLPTVQSTLHTPVIPDNMDFTPVSACGGNYNTAPAEVEPNDSCMTATLAALCDEHLNTLQFAGDVDYYLLPVAAATTVTFETYASTATTGTSCTDTKLWLYDSTCTEIASDDDGGTGLYSRLQQTLSPGLYYLEVSHWQRNQAGDYRLTIDSAAPTTCYGTSGHELRLGERLGERSHIGTQYTTDIEQIPSTNICVMLLGLTRIDPPLNLDVVGMPGCPLGVNPVIVLPAVPSVPGQDEFGIFIPYDNALAGGQLVLQALAIDPGANALGIITSRNRLTLTIGNENY